MRSILLSGAAVAALMTTSLYTSAQGADTDRYCVKIQGSPIAWRCGYETLGACQEATNSGEGTCVENPKFRHFRYYR
jgi:uncharacterized protein DUF3551